LQRDLIGEGWQCDSGPENLKNQMGFISEVWRNLAQIYLEATMAHYPEVGQVLATMNVNTVQESSRFKGILSVKFSDVSLAQKS